MAAAARLFYDEAKGEADASKKGTVLTGFQALAKAADGALDEVDPTTLRDACQMHEAEASADLVRYFERKPHKETDNARTDDV